MSQSLYRRALVLGAACAAMAAAPALAGMKAEKTVMVGGAAMYPSKSIVANAVNSKDHTTLVTAVKAAGLVDTLSGKGPFTVFAPTNAAFKKLPAGTVDTLLKPENKGQLTSVLTYHVVPGTMTATDIGAAIKAGGGQATLKTVQGGTLKIDTSNGVKVGNAKVVKADVAATNGVIHVIDTVLMPQD